jgi:hypothetical protein
MSNAPHRRTVQEFISFRFMITPVFIQIIWLIGSALIELGGLVSIFVSGDVVTILGGLLIGLPVSLLLWRVYCELVILLFRIHDAITETSGGGAHAPMAPPADA